MPQPVPTGSVTSNQPCHGEGCIECARLLKSYEDLTFECARIHNRLVVAMHLGDSRSLKRIEDEEFAAKIWRESIHDALVQHQGAAHLAAGA